MTAVIALADLRPTGCVRGVGPIRMPLGTHANAPTKEQFCAVVDSLLEREQAVVCVYPSWRTGQAKHNVRLARTLLGSERVVGVRSDLPPLALSLLTELLAHISPHVPPGILVAMVHRLANYMTAGAWLRSVTKLQHAPATLSHHLRSYLPRSAFVATIAPTPAVTNANTRPAVTARPHDPVYLLASPTAGNEEWLRDHLVPALRPSKVSELAAQPLAATFWGGKPLVEFAAFSTHPDALRNAVRSVRYRPCPWCEELVTSDPCPFCRMSASNASFQPSHTLPDSERLPEPAADRNDTQEPEPENTLRSET